MKNNISCAVAAVRLASVCRRTGGGRGFASLCLLLLLCGMMSLISVRGEAVEAPTIVLWPDGAPGAQGKGEADTPTLTLHLPAPEQSTGAAVIICPGGGYGGLMMSYEGNDVAEWLTRHGIAGIVLKYRVSPYRHPAPLQDGQRAVRWVRAHAEKLHLNPQRIGIMGFSAGGHLASTVGTHFDGGNARADDPVARVSCRPDFMLLIYPVVTMGEKTHVGSRNNLLGAAPSTADITLLSNELQVTEQTPPTFLAHSRVDSVVPVANSELFYAALQAHKVPAEFFELETGDHGLGCGHGKEWELWQQHCLAWLTERGLAK
jgi:acetyl esterase/lipase